MTHEPKKPGFGVIRDLFFTFSIFWAHLGTYVCPSVRAFLKIRSLIMTICALESSCEGRKGVHILLSILTSTSSSLSSPSELKPNDSASSFKSSINTSFSFVRILAFELTACSSPQTSSAGWSALWSLELLDHCITWYKGGARGTGVLLVLRNLGRMQRASSWQTVRELHKRCMRRFRKIVRMGRYLVRLFVLHKLLFVFSHKSCEGGKHVCCPFPDKLGTLCLLGWLQCA